MQTQDRPPSAAHPCGISIPTPTGQTKAIQLKFRAFSCTLQSHASVFHICYLFSTCPRKNGLQGLTNKGGRCGCAKLAKAIRPTHRGHPHFLIQLIPPCSMQKTASPIPPATHPNSVQGSIRIRQKQTIQWRLPRFSISDMQSHSL
jgi:hypothetical protein